MATMIYLFYNAFTNPVIVTPTLMSGVVIDAGSMHSSVTVYKWELGQPSKMQEVHSCEFEDLRGVTAFINQPAQVKDYIRKSKCLDTALLHASSDASINSSRLYMGCTGGMRSALRSKPVLAQQLISNLTLALKNVGKTFGVQETSLEVLDGVDEGVYGWVTVNAKALANQGAAKQVGSLDWGGASSQISFPATDFIATEYDHVRNVKVFEKVNKVYSVSQLCYGQNSALQRYFIQLMHEQFQTNGNILPIYQSPCHPKRMSSFKVKGEQVMSTCTRLKDKKFNEALTLAKNRTISFIGTGDQRKCEALVEEQFDVIKCKEAYEQHRTCFNASMIAEPPLNLKFYAFSTYWYLVEVLKLPAANVSEVESVSMTISDLDQILKKVCVRTTSTLKAVRASWGVEPAHNSCFRAVFMRRLLTEGYGFKHWTNIEFVSKVGGASVGWSRGYLLAHLGEKEDSEKLLQSKNKDKVTLSPKTISIPVMIFASLFTLCMVMVFCTVLSTFCAPMLINVWNYVYDNLASCFGTAGRYYAYSKI